MAARHLGQNRRAIVLRLLPVPQGSHYRCECRTFQVRNGSATSRQARTTFKTWLAGVDKANTFESFIIDDTFAADFFYRYLKYTAKDPAPFAILSEDDTVYGALNLNAAGPHDYLALRFPREIAYLRNAYRSPASSALKEETRPDESRRLPLRLEGDQPGADSIPSYSRDQTPISQEAVLLDIAGTLRRESVHYAGILATDILDTVFLCRYLREAVPNIRLVVFTSDLLLLRADENASMTGILSVTTYPLFARNQHGPRGSSRAVPRGVCHSPTAIRRAPTTPRAIFWEDRPKRCSNMKVRRFRTEVSRRSGLRPWAKMRGGRWR